MTRGSLYTKHRGIAIGEATNWRIPRMDQDDVRQEANLALWEATGAFDPARGSFPAFARVVIRRHMRDLLQAATRQKRTAAFDYDAEPVGDELETTIVHREQLQLALTDPRIKQRQAWRDSKRRQRAA